MPASIVLFDWLLAPIYILIICIIAAIIKKRKERNNPIYKFFLWGLVAKIIGAITLCLIYVYYYHEGGDTLWYHWDCIIFLKLFLKSPSDFFTTMFNLVPHSQQYFFFDSTTGYPGFWNDPPALHTVRFTTIVEMIGMGLYLPSSVIMAVISFSGVWKLYEMFCELYPNLYKQFAIVILFVPSVVFWGSGILKDSWTLSAACWYCYSMYKVFIVRDKILRNVITMSISIFIMVAIKPYIFVGLLPGSILWIISSRMAKVKNLFIRILITPIILLFGVSLGIVLWSATSSNLGAYSSIDSMLLKANVSYEDLKKDYYHGNSFDLGEYDPTVSGLLAKFPMGFITGLFRPFLWEAKNPVMLISGIENFIILLMTIYFLIRRPVSFIVSMISNPMVMFCFIFGVLFAFLVAMSTSNFGALVRLRIPAIPFFLAGLVLVEYLSRERDKQKKMQKHRHYASSKVVYTR